MINYHLGELVPVTGDCAAEIAFLGNLLPVAVAILLGFPLLRNIFLVVGGRAAEIIILGNLLPVAVAILLGFLLLRNIFLVVGGRAAEITISRKHAPGNRRQTSESKHILSCILNYS